MKKILVYCMSRSYGYYRIIPSLNSLRANGGAIDEVHILAEDNDLGFPLPKEYTVHNMSGQTFFPPDGPNYYTDFTYMSLMQAAMTKIFPQYDVILNIDADTIVLSDITGLWDLPIEDYYFAAVPEPWLTKKRGYPYYNTGVLLMNLAKLRADGKDDEIIDALNTRKYYFVNQDAEIEFCAGHILEMPHEYNVSKPTGLAGATRIRHFASEGFSWYDKSRIVQYYKG